MKNIFFLILLLLVCCKRSEKQTTVIGNIPNLPNGTIYLYEPLSGNNIDSTKTIKGKFKIVHEWKNVNEPVYIGLNHKDNKGVMRLFSFDTKAKYKGTKWGTSVFLSDSTITINGNLTYDTFDGLKLPSDKKLVTGPPLKTGKQTEAFYHIDGDLFEKIDTKTIGIIREKLNIYPYSYHLLYKINENKNSFSPQQVKEFLKSFKGEITQSKTYKKLYTYNEKRFDEKNISLPLLDDKSGVKKEILNKNYKKHLIIFWASWCGPCRQEIPLLKEIYQDHNKEIEFISISIDNDKKSWQKALTQENMSWKQLIVNEENPDYEKLQIQFKLNGAIPYTVLIDNNMKILTSFTGLSDQQELEKLIKQ